MKSLSDLPLYPDLPPVQPFNGPAQDSRARTVNSGALLLALGGPDAVLQAGDDADDAWDPAADEDMGGFDIHLGVYASD
jgi:hypothetical protein